MVPHGGGVTPISQTVDTELNQHVKREYGDLEAVELINLMRSGAVVPCTSKERSIDLMHEVLSNKDLHLQAAKGYKYTGATIALNGTEDQMVCKEAAVFFHELGMRAKINREVENVKAEVAAGRLAWNKAHVKALIKEYPARKKYDDVLRKIGELDKLEPGECGYLSEEEEAAVAAEDASESNMASEDEGGDIEEAAAAVAADEAAAVAPVEAIVAANAEASSGMSAAEADLVQESTALIDTYRQAIEELKKHGAVHAMNQLENEIRKERRRQRGLCSESPAVAAALQRQRDYEEQQLRKQRRLAADLNAKKRAAATVKQQIKDANALLNKRKKELMDAEALQESMHHFKTLGPKQLGQGHVKGDGMRGRRRRHEVLDRMARLGTGLSAPQRNDWQWFKEAWDDQMLEEHKGDWGGIFAHWIQGVLDRFEDNVGNAFSTFVHDETMRCLAEEDVLRLP